MQYEIKGNPFPVVICRLEQGETVCCQRGGMSWMSPNMQMETNAGGAIGKMFSRALTGESIFQNKYTAMNGIGEIAFASSVPGNILPFEISPSRTLVVQKSAYLASSPSVELSMFFQKKIGAGFFGGEGFIMQKLSGQGIAFVEIDGSVVEYDLKAGESILIDTGYLAAMDATCSVDIETVKGIGNALFGGEGLFNTRVSGPGHVWLQTMPVSALAGSVRPYIPTGN
ncbi:MAG: TIGR00266 family protein [Oscillospiraceae bacterium]|nr:TIGR00266 family protein [Oscillospiraceae bacterium]